MDTKIYAANMENYFKLDKIVDPGDMTRDELIDKLVEIAGEKRKIQLSNNDFINENIVTYEKDPSLVNEDVVKELEEISESLRDVSKNEYYDRGVSERIARILYRYYMDKGDYNKGAEYNRKIIVYELTTGEHDSNFTSPKGFKEVDEWIDRLPELNEEGKLGVLRLLANAVFDTSDCKGAYHRFERFEKYVNQEGFSYSTPEYPLRNAYVNAVLDTVSLTCKYYDDNAETPEDENNGKRTVGKQGTAERAELFSPEEMKHIRRVSDIFHADEEIATSINYMVYAPKLKYHLGDITLDEFLDNEYELFCQKHEEKGLLARIALFYAGAMYLDCLRFHREAIAGKRLEEIDNISRISREEYRNARRVKDNFFVLNAGAQFTRSATQLFGFDETRDYAFQATVGADKALSIHTVMVTEISQIIIKAILEDNPDFLQGVAGYSSDYIKDNPEKIMALMKDCAIFHDIGKHFCLDYTQLAYRNIMDSEFGAIKHHPENFNEFFSPKDTDTEEIKCIRDCAVLHHTWHNGEGGYPVAEHTKNQPFVDILSIADSIDAATDTIGRPYMPGKTLHALIMEFESFADTRYSSYVTQVLKDHDVSTAIQKLITSGRKDLIYKIYKRQYEI